MLISKILFRAQFSSQRHEIFGHCYVSIFVNNKNVNKYAQIYKNYRYYQGPLALALVLSREVQIIIVKGITAVNMH